MGDGSTFRVVLPAGSTRVVPSSPSRGVASPSTRRGRILVIDDDPTVGVAIRRMLHKDHDVDLTVQADIALEHVARGDVFDVIFCDVMMPIMTGVDFLLALERVAPHLAARVVFITGGVLSTAIRVFLESLPNLCLEKPFDPAALRRLVADRVAAMQ